MISALANRKVGFIGAGNMTRSIVGGLLKSERAKAQQIFVTNRSERKLQSLKQDFSIRTLETNEGLIEMCDVIVIAVKPQDLKDAIEPIGSSFTEDHIVISVAAGISIQSLQKYLLNVKNIVRVMPNTPISLQQGVIGFCCKGEDHLLSSLVENIFSPSGKVFKLEEGDEFEALTVAASSGIGFIFEIMQYWQEWLEEHGYEPGPAREMTVQTFLGASLLADSKKNTTVAELQNKVVSKKGVTYAGLESMRELELERALRYSFEKAVLRDQELGRAFS